MQSDVNANFNSFSFRHFYGRHNYQMVVSSVLSSSSSTLSLTNLFCVIFLLHLIRHFACKFRQCIHSNIEHQTDFWNHEKIVLRLLFGMHSDQSQIDEIYVYPSTLNLQCTYFVFGKWTPNDDRCFYDFRFLFAEMVLWPILNNLVGI